jgi:hypothetical protein
MGFRFRRRRGGRDEELGGDAAAVARVLEHAATTYGSDPADFDLEVTIGDLLHEAPTEDLRALAHDGVDEEELYDRELRPNWEGLGKAERASKVECFARFANSLGEEAGTLAALVRTKLLVLAWAYDRTYGEDYLQRVDREPERFGRMELSLTH